MNGLGLIAGSQVNARLVGRYGPATPAARRAAQRSPAPRRRCWSSCCVGGLGVGAVLAPMFVIVSSLAFVLPNSTALALADHPEVAGTASALLGTGQFMIGAAVAPVVGAAGTDSAVPMAVDHDRGRARRARRPSTRPQERPGMTLVTIAALLRRRREPRRARAGAPARRPVPRPPAPGADSPSARTRAAMLSKLASMAVAWGTPPDLRAEDLLPDEARRREFEREVKAFAETGPRRRSSGAPASCSCAITRRRCTSCSKARARRGSRQAMEIEGIDRAEAERRLDAHRPLSPRLPRGPLRRRRARARGLSPHAGLDRVRARRLRGAARGGGAAAVVAVKRQEQRGQLRVEVLTTLALDLRERVVDRPRLLVHAR